MPVNGANEIAPRSLVVLAKTGATLDKTALIKVVIDFLKNETDGENCFRGMVALGTLVADDASAKALALSLGAKNYLSVARQITGPEETKLKAVEAELQNLLK